MMFDWRHAGIAYAIADASARAPLESHLAAPGLHQRVLST